MDLHELDRAHDESKQQAEALIESVEQEKGKDVADKCRSEFNEFLDECFKKIKAKNENIKVSNLGNAFESGCTYNVVKWPFLSAEQSSQ